MGVFNCAARVIRGHFDVFDRAIGLIEDIERHLPPVEYHACTDSRGQGPGHFYDPAEAERLELAIAKAMIARACQIAQEVAGRTE